MSHTYRFTKNLPLFQTILIQATCKQHAREILFTRKGIGFEKLHAYSIQTKQWNWPIGTLVINKRLYFPL